LPRNDYLNKPARESEGDETELAASVQIDDILDPIGAMPPSLSGSPKRSKMKEGPGQNPDHNFTVKTPMSPQKRSNKIVEQSNHGTYLEITIST
jgi:hypothetical protein